MRSLRRTVIGVAVAISLAGCGIGLPRNALDAWLVAVTGGTQDRGWSLLDDITRDEWFGGDEATYLAEVRAADWSGLRWGEPQVEWTDDGFARIVAPLRSASSTVPRFILDRRIVHGVCEDGEPVAIGAYEDQRLFQGGGIGGGGLAGGGVACNARFTDDRVPGGGF